ncbi:MAG: D-alanyl-D-alanine carboxypeptidase family protein [Clostridiales bacterium]|nr:D-alanyl-D-alanine carboxypeptidase family protein [Clostridiales bacterium]
MPTETTTETTIETTAETAVQTTATAKTAETTAKKPATSAAPAATTAAAPAMTAPTVREGEYPAGETTVENIDGFTYVNGILIANKTYLLPADYDPGKILPEAQTAFDTMRAAAKEEGLTLKIVSGYRSYQKQDKVYHNYAARDGAALADRYSARAGSSEHQTGYAMDINSVRQSFAETKEGKWLAAHCAEYGFILRYPKDKEAETGFMYEPWHVRYLGVELAQKITDSGLCLEEYLGITSAYAEEQ